MILFSDFDGTLYPHDHPEIFNYNLQMIQKFRAAGNQLVLATGRSLGSLKRAFPDYQSYLDAVMLDNGSVCLDYASKIIFQRTMPPKLVDEVTRVLRSYKSKDNEIEFIYYYDLLEHPDSCGNITKIRCWFSDDACAQEALRELSNRFSSRTQNFLCPNPTPAPPKFSWIKETSNVNTFIEIIAKESGKETAIEHYLERYSVTRNHIASVGDGINDLEMLKHFNGYAITNSPKQVIQTVGEDHVVTSVGKLIEQLLTKGKEQP